MGHSKIDWSHQFDNWLILLQFNFFINAACCNCHLGAQFAFEISSLMFCLLQLHANKTEAFFAVLLFILAKLFTVN